jgi:hypothetical protein
MKIVKKEQPATETEATFAEVFDAIAEQLRQLGKSVSHQRDHAVESQLRRCIRLMGYRPRETAKKPATIPELASQCQQAIGLLNGVVPPKQHENLSLCALAVLSNVEWEVKDQLSGNHEVPPVPEVPETPEAPGADSIPANQTTNNKSSK